MTELAPSESPRPQCSSLSKSGKPCKAYAVQGGSKCRAHSMSLEEMTRVRSAAIAARKERAKAKQDLIESSRLGFQALLGARLEARASEAVSRLEELALSEDPNVALKGLALWAERVHGRPVQPTQEVSSALPVDREALIAMTPEERRALLQAMPPLEP